MKLADISPIHGVPFKAGKCHKAGNWHALDAYNASNYDTRERHVYHYGTLMGVFVSELFFDVERGAVRGTWKFNPISTGWGSVSDQGGMNKIMRGTGWYYSRKGGADYIETGA